MKQSIVVVISTYNGRKYIIEQIESILNQTRPVERIFIFDDASTDDTVDILEKNYKNNNKIQIEVNTRNKGWKRNFIDALKYVKAELVFLADQDDIWNSTKVEEMTHAMENNSSINLLTSNYELLFLEESTTEKSEEEKRLIKDGRLMQVRQIPREFYVRQPGCSYLVRKSFFDEYMYLWNADMPHDSFLWKTALLSNSLYSLNKPLFKWRRHASNESNRARINVTSRIKEVKSNYNYIIVSQYAGL